MLIHLDLLIEIAEIEFSKIVVQVFTDLNGMRIIFIDESYCDVWFSLKLEGRYSYHWERSFLDGTIYREDNAPHLRWKGIRGYPAHFHNGSEYAVEESRLPSEPAAALRHFLNFIQLLPV